MAGFQLIWDEIEDQNLQYNKENLFLRLTCNQDNSSKIAWVRAC